MAFLERIDTELKAALKGRKDSRLNILRMLKSDLQYKEKELGRALTEEDIIVVLSSAAKKRTEAIDEYVKGGREDLAEAERAEFEVIKEFLPRQLSPEELEHLIDSAISETGASSISDLGAVMKVLMPKVRGRADGKAVNVAVRDKLMNK
jgi:uncharacterized protein YqeY